jgi:hypothetical protein
VGDHKETARSAGRVTDGIVRAGAHDVHDAPYEFAGVKYCPAPLGDSAAERERMPS